MDYRIHYAYTILICILSVTRHISSLQIRGSEGFLPCTYEKDPLHPKANILICDEEASAEFKDTLPVIESGDIPLSRVQIIDKNRITRCPPNAFTAINLRSHSFSSHSALEVIEIRGTRLTDYEPACFEGLVNLRELYIVNAPGSESTQYANSIRTSLFRELNHLRSLRKLHLEHVDLSGGIPDYAFGRWSRELRHLQFVHNRLSYIDNNTFSGNAIEQLDFEHQIEGWKLLANAPEWASKLRTLKSVSFKGSKLQTRNRVELDFGGKINKQLVTLNLEACGLTNLLGQAPDRRRGVNLTALGPYLKQLWISRNQFGPVTPEMDSLTGLKSFKRLRVLGVEHNQHPLYTVPTWFSSDTNIEELYMKNSGLVYLPARAFPASLQVLQLSENPLRSVDEKWAINSLKLEELHMNYIRLENVDISGHQADWVRAFKPLRKSLRLISLMGCQLRPAALGQAGPSTMAFNRSSMRSSLNLGLSELGQLKTIVLNNNQLTEVPSNAFGPLLELKNLVLAGSQLETVEEPRVNEEDIVSHRGRNWLKRLDLRYNRLTTLNRCAPALGFNVPLEELLPLRPVWLSGESSDRMQKNRTRYLIDSQSRDEQWFGGLGLTGNEFICDCRLAWLRHYITSMEDRIIQEQPDKMAPKGYDAYKKEALDFKCADTGPWKGRQFLSLRPVDLYAASHNMCQNKPDVYGSGLELNRPLTPCARLFISRWSEMSRRLGVASMVRNRLQQDELETAMESATTESAPSTGLSTVAIVLVVVAGAVSLCFITISTIIIFWLCCRIRGNERLYKERFYASSRYQRGRSCLGRCRNACTYQTGCIVCTCCTRSRTCGSRNDMYSPQIAHAHMNRGPNLAGYTSSEDHIESYYSQTSDGDMPIRVRTKNKKRRAARKLQTPAEGFLDQRVNSPDWIFDSGIGETNSERRHPLQVIGKLSLTDHSVESPTNIKSRNPYLGETRPPPPITPLPPIPAPRKTKSTADIFTVASMNSETTKPNKEVSAFHPNLNAASMDLLTIGIENDTRIDPDLFSHQAVLPWRSKSVDPSQKWKGQLSNRDSRSTSRTFIRGRLYRSTGTKIPQTPDRNPTDGWIRASKRRIQRGVDWLRRTANPVRRRKPVEKRSISKEPVRTMDRKDIEAEIEENLKRMQGPDLPKPYIILPAEAELTHKEEEVIPILHNDYLPMNSHEAKQSESNRTGKDLLNEISSTEGEKKQDPDVKNSEEADSSKLDHYVLRKPKLRRKPSRSAENPADMDPAEKHKPLRLSGNLYSLSLYDEPTELSIAPLKQVIPLDLDLPPPPPPPPKVVMDRQPLWQNYQNLSSGSGMATTNKVPADEHLPTRRPQRTPPPVGPKPRDFKWKLDRTNHLVNQTIPPTKTGR